MGGPAPVANLTAEHKNNKIKLLWSKDKTLPKDVIYEIEIYQNGSQHGSVITTRICNYEYSAVHPRVDYVFRVTVICDERRSEAVRIETKCKFVKISTVIIID